MDDAALNEAVARAMGWTQPKKGSATWYAPEPDGYGASAPPNYLADDYSGVPAMEAWCRERELFITLETDGGRYDVSLSGQMDASPIAHGYGSDQPRALALAIVAAVEAGR